jgi:signal transduction histidine kinase
MMVMADLLEDAPPEKQAEFITNIRHSLMRMEWLVSALLKIAKLDAQVVRFAPEQVEAGALVEAALEPLLIQLDIREQQLERRGSAEIFCDRRWTVEALTNVLKNASEHSPTGSTIVVELGSDPICAWIAVTDSGKGLTNAEIATLFRRFEGSRSEYGYGIGLPLALAIMRGQEGDIQVEGTNPDPTKGATFTLKFYQKG